MKFKVYQKMTQKQKEEYNYYFDKHYNFSIRQSLNIVIGLFMMTLMILMMSYMIITDNSGNFAHLKNDAQLLVQSSARIMSATATIIFALVIYDAIRLGYKIYKEVKWRKKNKIKWG